jgi:hypothetical protein
VIPERTWSGDAGHSTIKKIVVVFGNHLDIPDHFVDRFFLFYVSEINVVGCS